MNRKTLFAGGSLLLAVLLAASFGGCQLDYQDEVELAKAVMRSVEQESPTGSYKSLSARVAPPAGISILVGPADPSTPPPDGPWTIPLTVTFSDFVPPGHEGSSVSGQAEAVLVIDFDKGSPVDLSMSFVAELAVAGDAEGSYLFDASLHYDFSTGTYSYSGTVQIDEYVYTFKG
jgi:hypothetical protein